MALMAAPGSSTAISRLAFMMIICLNSPVAEFPVVMVGCGACGAPAESIADGASATPRWSNNSFSFSGLTCVGAAFAQALKNRIAMMRLVHNTFLVMFSSWVIGVGF